jgi:hypothetical protein
MLIETIHRIFQLRRDRRRNRASNEPSGGSRVGRDYCRGAQACRVVDQSAKAQSGPYDCGGQKLRKRKSLAVSRTCPRAESGSMRAISTAPVIVEKIVKKARSLSAIRRPGMNGTIRFL